MRRAARNAGAYSILVLLLLLISGCAAPETCNDSLNILLDLIDQRLAIADEVARSKWNSGAAVEDPTRENEIVEAIERDAAKYRLTPALAGDFFRAQIEASKIVQNARMSAWHAANLPKFADTPDLQRDIRPQLDRLTPALLEALMRSIPALRAPAALARLNSYAATNAARIAAIAPLRNIAVGN